MRKFALIVALLTTTSSVIFSQKIRIGILAGPAIVGTTGQNTNVKSPDSTKDHTRSISSVFSFFGGLVASIPISNNIMFRPQLQYVEKGWKNHLDYSSSPDYDTRLKAQCIDLPLNFVYNVPTKNGRFFIGAGPYLSVALSGTFYDESSNTTEKLVFKSSDTTGRAAHRIDIGANLIAGYEFRNGVFISLNYALGFIDFRTAMKNNPNASNKNTAVELGIGYMFK